MCDYVLRKIHFLNSVLDKTDQMYYMYVHSHTYLRAKTMLT